MPDTTKSDLALQLIDLHGAVSMTLRSLSRMLANLGLDMDTVYDMDVLHARLRLCSADVYVDMYTEDELRAAIAYAESPSGMSMLSKSNEVADRIEQASQSVFQATLRD